VSLSTILIGNRARGLVRGAPALELDRYTSQLIPGLQQVFDLTRALKGMVAAAGDTSLANREEALAKARRVLARARDNFQTTR
jgi:hypothetical protein